MNPQGANSSPPPTRPSHVPWLFGGMAAFSALAAIFAAWYTVGVSTFGMRASVDFSLWGGCWAGGMGIGMPCGTSGSPGPFNTTNAMLPSLVCAVVSFLLYTGSAAMGYGRKMAPRAAGVLSLMAAASSIIAPLALMTSIAPALAGGNFGGLGQGTPTGGPGTSFWGTTTTTAGGFMPLTIDWGPGAGWFLSIFAAIFGLVAGLSAVTGRPGDVAIRPPTTYMQPMVFAPMPYGMPPSYGYPAPSPPPYAYGYPYGMPQGYGPPAVYGPAPAPAAPASVACPSCGTPNAPDARMCSSCFSALAA